MEKVKQIPEYEKPVVEEVSLVTEEEVTSGFLEGDQDVVSSIF